MIFPGFNSNDLALANAKSVRNKLILLQREIELFSDPLISRFCKETYVTQNPVQDSDQWIAFAPKATIVQVPHIHMVLASWHPDAIWFGINFEFIGHFVVLASLIKRKNRLQKVVDMMRQMPNYTLSLRYKTIPKINGDPMHNRYWWELKDRYSCTGEGISAAILAEYADLSGKMPPHPESDRIYNPVLLFRRPFAIAEATVPGADFLKNIRIELARLEPIMATLSAT